MNEEAVFKRFWEKVDIGPADVCWRWRGATQKRRGYGLFRFRGPVWLAHRVAWTLTFGEIPDGLNVCHRCDHTWCVNPSCLFLGTQKDNMMDAAAKGRVHAQVSPETLTRGDEHWTRKYPERHPRNRTRRLPEGDNHWSRREPWKLKRGETSGQTTISDGDVRSIRQRAIFGRCGTIAALAKEYGLSVKTIHNIVLRHTWAHVV